VVAVAVVVAAAEVAVAGHKLTQGTLMMLHNTHHWLQKPGRQLVGCNHILQAQRHQRQQGTRTLS